MSEIHIYTDGSYNETLKTIGYAAVVIFDEGVPHKEKVYYINGKEDSEELIKYRNYAGELIAAWTAIKELFDTYKKYGKEDDKVIIYHDYEGVGAWPTGKYKNPGNDFSAWYRNQMIAAGEMVDIEYVWVKGHSGNYWNEKADKLAKEACELL